MKKISGRMFMTAITTAALIGGGATAASAQATQADRTFQLETVTGAALPVVVDEDDGRREELLSATLTLSTTGRWTLTSTERETCGERVEVDQDTDIGMYRMSGQDIQFLDSDGDIPPTLQAGAATPPSEIEVDELSVGSFSGNNLSVRLTDGHTVLVFRE